MDFSPAWQRYVEALANGHNHANIAIRN